MTRGSAANHPVVSRDRWVAERKTLLAHERFRQRMGWPFKWVSSHGTDFNRDFGVTFTPEEVAKGKLD